MTMSINSKSKSKSMRRSFLLLMDGIHFMCVMIMPILMLIHATAVKDLPASALSLLSARAVSVQAFSFPYPFPLTYKYKRTTDTSYTFLNNNNNYRNNPMHPLFVVSWSSLSNNNVNFNSNPNASSNASSDANADNTSSSHENNDKNDNGNDDANAGTSLSSLQVQAVQAQAQLAVKYDIEKFDSYARNIARTRRPNKINTGSISTSNSAHDSSGNSSSGGIQIQLIKTTSAVATNKDNSTSHHKQQEIINYNPNTCMVAIKSFHHSLQQQSLAWKNINTEYTSATSNIPMSKSQIHELQQNLNKAIIQAVRAAADYNDYNIILKIIHSSIDYATQLGTFISTSTSTSASIPIPILHARIFGEAITELNRTKVSTSKIKKIWKLLITLATTTSSSTISSVHNYSHHQQQHQQHQSNFNYTNTSTSSTGSTGSTNIPIVTQPSAFELNAMLITLSSRGKTKAALSLFYRHVFHLSYYHDDNHDHHDKDKHHNHSDHMNAFHIDGDHYTTSTIMNILAESIASDVLLSTSTSTSKSANSYSSIINLSSSSTTTTIKKNGQRKYQLPSTKTATSSPCWQWQEAEFILDTIENNNLLSTTNTTTTMLNNHVYATVLKVNEEATDLYKYPGNRHFGSTTAMAVLERMRRQNISPDVVTCSAVMAAFDKGMQWKAAVALLKSMQRSSTTSTTCTAASTTMDDIIGNQNHTTDSKEKWVLPPPNQYSYASAISACARSGQFNEAIDILDSLRPTTTTYGNTNSNAHQVVEKNTTYSNLVTPNTWIYNAALAACMPTKNQARKYKLHNRNRSKTAMEIFNRMKEDSENGMDTAPDTVTYNMMITAMGNLVLTDFFDETDSSETSTFTHDIIYTEDHQPSASELETNILQLLDEMKKIGVNRDPITYRNAILVCQEHAKASMRILDMALDDSNNFSSSIISKWGSMAIIKRYLINVAMSVCASKGDMDLIAKLFEYMRENGIHSDSRSMNHLIIALSTAGYCENSMWILNAMKGDGAANAMFQEEYNINIIESGNFVEKPMVEEYHYSSAITCCLRQGELFPALKILNGMKVHGLRPNESNLHGIIVAYCKLATEASSLEFKEAKMKEMKKANKKSIHKSPILHVEYKTSRDRAVAALAMLKSLKEAPFRLISIVASACAASGMWVESRDLLWSMHISAVKEKYEENRFELVSPKQGSALAELPKLHTSLLKLCARSGNVTAALWYSDAIQDLAFKFERRHRRSRFKTETILSESQPIDDTVSDANILMDDFASVSEQYNRKTTMDGIGMSGEEWKLVNIAASKSRHWKVCLGVLQFLKPYLEATHPKNAALEDEEYDVSMMRLSREYESLARTLTDSILAFEARSQYAWALRAIDDWMIWSGRRPRKEAIVAACRILANRGLGNQVASLVSKVLSIPSYESNSFDESVEIKEDGIPSYETSYERAVYTEAITSLFQHGFYDNADELYATAASQGYLPWAVVDKKSKSTSSRVLLDLHGMNKGVAHSAVRVSLQQIMQTNAQNGRIEQNVMIVTGKGRRSSQHLRPVLRPEVQRMLMEEFFPPLNSISVPGNLGALRISSDDINAWLEHQQQQRGARFLAMANILKSLTSGARLRQLLKKKLEDGDNDTSK